MGLRQCFRTWLERVAQDNSMGGVKIWGKIPSGASWLGELRQGCAALSPAPEVYLLSNRTLPQEDWFTTVPLPASHPMVGEYGLIILTPTLGVMILAQRVPGEATAIALNPQQTLSPQEAGRSRLRLAVTLNPTTISNTLAEVGQWVTEVVEAFPYRTDLQALLADWEKHFPSPAVLSPHILDRFLTQQLRMEEDYRQRLQSLKQTARTAVNLSTQNQALLTTLRLKDDFLNAVGEELRSPLATIKTALPLLGNATLKPQTRQRYLDMIEQQCDRQRSLINGVLDLLHLEMSVETVVPAPIDLCEVVPGVVSTYQPLAEEKGIQLVYTIPNTLPPTSCPESWLRQMVIHLLQNSIKFTPSGGQIKVTASTQGEDWVVLAIRDSGIGIPNADLPHIFEHFYRGRHLDGGEGAGLGLAIVQQLLLYCGGQVRVDSQPGRGTQFRLLLPMALPDGE